MTVLCIFLMKQPPILMQRVKDIMEQIYQMKGKKTVLLISHRLANVTAADKIYVLEQGKIAEQGNHETLITQNGSYAKLWNTQQKLEDYRKEKAS